MRRVFILKRKMLEKTSISLVIIDELMMLKEWYIEWMSTDDSTGIEISKVSIEELWETFLLKKSQEEKVREEEERIEQVQMKREAAL
eukprot:6722853-Ditylum_brightwellii.AAC.1